MAGGSEHLMFGEEPSFGSPVTPDKAIPVRSSNLTGAMPLMIPDVTGGGRGDRPGLVGEIAVGPGDINTLLYPVDLGFLFRSTFGARSAVGAGSGYRNALLMDDELAFDTFTIQKRYRSDLAENLRGAKITGWTIGARTREFATMVLSMVGKDSAMSTGTWSDGSASEPVVDPVPYTTPFPEAFTFYQGVLLLGGSVAMAGDEMVVTGGTERADFDNIEISAALNVSTDAYGVNLGDRTIQTADEGKREITVRFDPNFNTSGDEFYNAWKDNVPAVIELFFEGPEYDTGFRHELKITLPHVNYSAGGNPDLNATYGLKRQTIEGRAFVDQTLLADIGVVWQSTQDLS